MDRDAPAEGDIAGDRPAGRSGAQQRASVVRRSPTPSIWTGAARRPRRAGTRRRATGRGGSEQPGRGGCISCVTVISPRKQLMQVIGVALP